MAAHWCCVCLINVPGQVHNKNGSPGHVTDMQELTGRGACPPDFDIWRAIYCCFVKLWINAGGPHAVVLMDQAGGHMTGKRDVPANIWIVALPSKCLELNRVENIWQIMRDSGFCNRT